MKGRALIMEHLEDRGSLRPRTYNGTECFQRCNALVILLRQPLCQILPYSIIYSWQTDRQTDGQAGGQAGRQTTDRQNIELMS